MRLLLQLLLLTIGASSTAAPARTLASGLLQLPAAAAFGDPGFHQVLAASGRVPSDLHPPQRFRLVLTLRDAGRPRQTCSSEHPLSGCATVDWADDPSRPKVPTSGVFASTVTVHLAAGTGTLFLTPSGSLSRRPNPYEPG